MSEGQDRITLTKFEAGRCQLNTAIELWFGEKDPASIHTLAYAAYEVLHFVSEDRNRTAELIFDSALIKDEYRSQWIACIKKEANELKHADRAPAGTIDLSRELAIYLMMFALAAVECCGFAFNDVEATFTYWLWVNRPQYLNEKGRKQFLDKVSADGLDDLRRLSKREFFDLFMDARQPPQHRGVTIGHIQLPKF